jgi:Glycosyl hydrolase family 47
LQTLPWSVEPHPLIAVCSRAHQFESHNLTAAREASGLLSRLNLRLDKQQKRAQQQQAALQGMKDQQLASDLKSGRVGGDRGEPERQEAVRGAMKHAFNSFEKYAWGMDELCPMSKRGKNSFSGLGATVRPKNTGPAHASACLSVCLPAACHAWPTRSPA